MATLRFVFDYISPYAYLGWTQIHALAARHGAEVEPVPVLFAGLLNAHGTKGPAEVPAKRDYLFKNIVRIAHRLGVPVAAPASHPFNPLLALRVSSIPMERESQRRLIDGLYRATWAEGLAVNEPGVVRAVCDRAGLDGAALVAEADSRAAKDRVRAQTDDAIARGVFGVPTTIVNGELFWGVDSLPDLDVYLRGEDPVRAEALERFRAIAPTASR